MNAQPDGTGSTLVFLHGGGVGPWMWAEQTAYFARDFTVLTPTLPGHHPRRRTTFSTHAQAAEAVAAEIGLPDRFRPITVIGFSLGGQTALQLAASHPGHVERLVVVSSLLRPWRGAAALGLLAAGSAPLSRSRRFAAAQAAQLGLPGNMFENYYALSRSMSAQTLRHLIQANFSFSVPPEVLESPRPVLLMAGDKEEAGLVRGMEHYSSAFRNCTFQVHAGVGHGMPLAQPARFNAALHEWLGLNRVGA